MLDIKEAKVRGSSDWNLSSDKKFYFDGSILNSLYDIYEKHSLEMGEYGSYLKGSDLVSSFNKMYLNMREGYVVGEKIDSILYQIVRSYHHKNDLISANDPPTIAYIKAKLIARMSDDSVIKYLGWKSVPERAVEVLKIATQDKVLKNKTQQIIKLRNDLIKETDKLLELIKSKKF